MLRFVALQFLVIRQRYHMTVRCLLTGLTITLLVVAGYRQRRLLIEMSLLPLVIRCLVEWPPIAAYKHEDKLRAKAYNS